MRKKLLYLLITLAFATCAMLAACAQTSRAETTHLSIWTYYNGDQLVAFQDLIQRYNSTIGAEKNVVIEASNVGSVEDLRDAVMQSANGKVGASPLPNIFMTYADTAYAIDQMGLLVDMAPYLTSEEHDAFVTGYLEEGTLGEPGSIKIFPIAKSAEILVLNKTDFEPFAQATGASYDDLATIEGLVRTSQAYYEWTDSLTDEPNDGKAFYGRDSLANYFFIGAKQLGHTLLSVEDGKAVLDFDKETIRTLWDNYYIPFVNGYFNAQGYYRSDDVKTGAIISLVGSSSGATYFPTQLIADDGTERPIDMVALPCPRFANGENYVVQQGAGMAVINTSDAEVQASVDFLKWFSSPEQNIQFSVSSGYLPVMKEANTVEEVSGSSVELDERMAAIIEVAMAEVSENQLYTPHAFENGTAVRNILEYSLKDLATADAAAVQSALAAGASREEALAPYVSDAYFEQWYNKTKSEVEALL